MCLDKVTETGLNLKGKGYKVIHFLNESCNPDDDNCYVGLHFFHRAAKGWLDASPVDSIASIPWKFDYRLSFHLFESVEDAKQYVSPKCQENGYKIVEVEYEKGHTRGTQRSYRYERIFFECIVADRIKYGKILFASEKIIGDNLDWQWAEYKGEQLFLEQSECA